AKELPGAYGRSRSNCAIRYSGEGTWECTWETGEHIPVPQKSKSSDGGLTWSDPVPASGIPEKYNAVAVSPEGNAVRVSSKTIPYSPTEDVYTLETYVETSSDNGVTWQPPKLVYTETYPTM